MSMELFSEQYTVHHNTPIRTAHNLMLTNYKHTMYSTCFFVKTCDLNVLPLPAEWLFFCICKHNTKTTEWFITMGKGPEEETFVFNIFFDFSEYFLHLDVEKSDMFRGLKFTSVCNLVLLSESRSSEGKCGFISKLSDLALYCKTPEVSLRAGAHVCRPQSILLFDRFRPKLNTLTKS